MLIRMLLATLAVSMFDIGNLSAGERSLRIATFNVDATPPIGSPVAYAPTRKIEDPLSARGIVVFGDGKPVVLCAVDWIGIGNGGQDVWKEKLAQAAGTTADRVTVHVLHQHDGPRCDFSAEALLDERGLGSRNYDTVFLRDVVQRAAVAVGESVKSVRKVTHIGVGKAKVKKVASNRRILGSDGKVKIIRWSKSTNPEAIAAPEGVIDPFLRLVSFWDGDTPLASITYYATHPQSYYGKGDVTSEFVGLGRAAREKELPGVAHIHFNGAIGNVAAGKYNDGSKALRPILAERMRKGMQAAWEATKKTPITAADVQWRSRPVLLPVANHLVADELRKTLDNEKAEFKARGSAARNLAWVQRMQAKRAINVCCLRLGKVHILHMPGELFIEYQLAAQKMRPNDFVCMAAYGDYGPGYIGTEIAYTQGGYETSQRASRVAPKVERVLMKAMAELLK
ncbi:MAG: hypothetical protein HOL01_17170 [Planctomycetaceae bacterium]|nr:hypothetical protein [Planctomycetaceae bacterium]